MDVHFKSEFKEKLLATEGFSFDVLALELFRYQAIHCSVYAEWLHYLGKKINHIEHWTQIPFLPISFFKNHKVITHPLEGTNIRFESSGTTGVITSVHEVYDQTLYNYASIRTFERIYGPLENYLFLGLLPAYLDRPNSSLVWMAQQFVSKARPGSGLFNKNYNQVESLITKAIEEKIPVFLLGVTFSLLDLAERGNVTLKGQLVMETGGMKGRRKELTREELHQTLQKGLHVEKIHSEYGMTELLSQAYAPNDGKFTCGPWMKVILRDMDDPLTQAETITRGGISIIDLLNIDSCGFIATQDIGQRHSDGTFEVLGRFDHSDVRGCNQMYVE